MVMPQSSLIFVSQEFIYNLFRSRIKTDIGRSKIDAAGYAHKLMKLDLTAQFN